jgi:hypothetical protein
MIKNIIFVIFCSLLFAACTKKTDMIFDKSVDERLAEALAKYQSALADAPGWKLFVYPQGLNSQNIKVGGLSYYVKFGTDNRVSMVSDFMTSISTVPASSGYRLKALQRPSLIFDTYSYMHIPADPDPDVSFSPTGTGGYGWGTDFNFAFTKAAPSDTMQLEGIFNKSSAVLVKATQAEMDAAFKNSRLGFIMTETFNYPVANPYITFPAGAGGNIAVGLDIDNVIMSFTSLVNNDVVSTSVAYSYTTYGLHLQNAVTFGTYTFQDIYYDDVKKVYYILSGATRVEFVGSATPSISIALTTTIGAKYTTLTIPFGAGLPGESPLFIQKYNTAANGMFSGPYGLELDDLDFVFNAALKTLNVNAYVYQDGVGPYLCQYSYSYTVDANGQFKFTKTVQNGNAALVVSNMNNILTYIQNDLFKINGVATSSGFLGQVVSQTTPTFYFTGNLY